jgi:hypothetical protein
MFDHHLHPQEIGAEVTPCRGRHRAESILALAPTRDHCMFREHPNLNMRGVAAENGVPIAITMPHRVMIYKVEPGVQSLGVRMRNMSQTQVM